MRSFSERRGGGSRETTFMNVFIFLRSGDLNQQSQPAQRRHIYVPSDETAIRLIRNQRFGRFAKRTNNRIVHAGSTHKRREHSILTREPPLARAVRARAQQSGRGTNSGGCAESSCASKKPPGAWFCTPRVPAGQRKARQELRTALSPASGAPAREGAPTSASAGEREREIEREDAEEKHRNARRRRQRAICLPLAFGAGG